MKRFVISFTAIVFGAVFGFGLLGVVSAPTASAATCKNEINFLGINPWYHDLCDGDGNVAINDLNTDIWHIVLNVLSIAILLAGYIAIALVIWGGVKYMTAGGESSKVASAKTTIINAAIGLLIALSANAIVTFVAGNLG